MKEEQEDLEDEAKEEESEAEEKADEDLTVKNKLMEDYKKLGR